MTKLYRIFKSQVLVAVVLFGVSIGFGQTVTVPSNCIVVSTNTTLGGILGAGGKVTSGGEVSMADEVTPNGGTFTFAGPPGVTLGPTITWKLIGDLSAAVTIPNYNSPVQPANGTSATIISYNKFLRPSESLAPSIATWARSKGRVTVGYTTNQLLCPGVFIGGSISFEIYKTYAPLPNASAPANVPAIVGPSCLLPNTLYTFSVDQIASDNAIDNFGFDNYYWSGLPSGVTFYTSADNSSITFTSPSTLPNTIDLKCCFGRANPFDGNASSTHTTCVTKRLVPEVVQPKVNVPCVDTGATSFVVAVNPPDIVSGYMYTWATTDTSWTLTPTSTATVKSVSIALLASDLNPGTITLTIGNGFCLPNKVFTYKVNRNFVVPFAVSTPLGTAPVTCLAPVTSSTTTLQYSLPASALGNATTWSISPNVTNGLSISNANANGSIVNVTVPTFANAIPGAYILKAVPNNSCSGSTSITLNVKPKAPASITGTSCIDRNGSSTLTYNCAASVGATSYTWTLPTGWTTTAVANTTALPTIIVTSGGSSALA